jgi:phage replication-related protein YjqB (UPF0714/DUF867 family)
VLIKDAGIETGVFERNVETSREDFSGCFPNNILNQCATVGTTIEMDIQVRNTSSERDNREAEEGT